MHRHMNPLMIWNVGLLFYVDELLLKETTKKTCSSLFFFFLTAPILEVLRNSNDEFVVCLRELRILLNSNFCDF